MNGRGGRMVAIVVGVVLAVAALKLARAVLLPLALGLFLATVAYPVKARLYRALPRRLKWLGVVVAMLLIVAGLGAFAAAIGWSGRAVAEELRTRRPEIERRVAPLRERAARFGIDIPGGGDSQGTQGTQQRQQPQSQPGPPQGGEQPQSSGGQGGTAERALHTLVATFGGLLLALAFAALGMAEADEVRARLRHMGGGGRRALDAFDEAAPAFRRYVWVKTLTSAITGLATGLAALAFGLPLAWVWGFIAFLFEYVPTVGSLLAVVPPVLMALAEGGPGRAGAVLLVIGGLQVFFGNVVDPRLEGRLMAVSPFGVLLSIVFWGWLWGAIGALLAVPLTVAVVIACRHIPGAQAVPTLVAGDGVPDESS